MVTPVAQLRPSGEITRETLLALNAICGAEELREVSPGELMLAGGMGTGGFAVDSTSKDAQGWFDYGLALSHAFYHQDAIAAMKKAVEADPDCSLCAWGEAWVRGPTLNYPIIGQQVTDALAAAERARRLAKPGDEKARRLADAMVARYAKTKTREMSPGLKVTEMADGAERTFGVELAKIAADYPGELELAVLAAHSQLIPVRSGDNAGLMPALVLLEDVLSKRPDDTGAIHYYIHATEFDGRAEDAIPYAERLGLLAPAASHLVHMPAHTFFRAGRYHEAAVVNALAIEADMDWARTGANGSFPGSRAAGRMNPSLPPYYAHNLSFGLAGAMMSGDAQLALKYADHAATSYPDSLAPIMRAGIAPRTWVALARHAPDRALALPESTGDDARFAIYRAYARGEALLVKGDAAGARREIETLKKIVLARDSPGETMIALSVLEGRVAMAEGSYSRAVRMFERGANHQEARFKDSWDPPSWWYPVRRSVAAAHLKAGDLAKAETEAKKSLAAWKHDPLALWVLGKAEQGLGRATEGAAHLDEARRLWRGDFDSITVDAI
jgi:tetratricopeptide (TPR) repeat protein